MMRKKLPLLDYVKLFMKIGNVHTLLYSGCDRSTAFWDLKETQIGQAYYASFGSCLRKRNTSVKNLDALF